MREPPEHVRTAFGASGPGEPLTGGQGTTWRYGDLVLKPLDLSASALAWQARHTIAAGNHLHEALRRLPKPDFIDEREDRWAVADRIAWREQPAGPGVRTPLLQRLLAADVPDQVSQLMHCDLTGNVLFEPGLRPPSSTCRCTGGRPGTRPRSC